MTTMNASKAALSILALAALSACGGGGGGTGTTTPPPPPKTIADHLDYTAPTSGTYILVKDASSTPTHLVLDLLGPAGALTSGVGFYLSADSNKVTWAKVASGDAEYIQNGAFNLGTGTQLIKSKVAGDQLQAGVYQKGATVAPVTLTSTTVLAKVALDLKSNVPLGAVNFSAVSGKAVVTNGSASPAAITLAAGAIQAN